MQKVYADATRAIAGLLKDGMVVMSGGFGLCGILEALIAAIKLSGAKGRVGDERNDSYGRKVANRSRSSVERQILLCSGHSTLSVHPLIDILVR